MIRTPCPDPPPWQKCRVCGATGKQCLRGESGPQHVCGLSGYNGMIDPPCPACEANHAPKKRSSEGE